MWAKDEITVKCSGKWIITHRVIRIEENIPMIRFYWNDVDGVILLFQGYFLCVRLNGRWNLWLIFFFVVFSLQLATRSIEPSFGLLFGDLLNSLEVGTTGAAIIMSAMDVSMNFSGLFVGPLLKEFSYRKVAVAGSILCSIGLALTSPAASMAHILATYSVLNGKYFF